MKLTELFTGKTNIETTTTQNKVSPSHVAEINRQIRSLVPGQTLRGEVVGRSGSEVQIKLAADMILNARVDQNINLEMGRSLTFEVKNNGAALMLSPLFTNVATDENVLKALDMAGLPVNETSVEMTKQMMEAGLPVNKSALQQVYREVANHLSQEVNNLPDTTLSSPTEKISDVVNLHKLGLPVSEENLSQMESYRNLTYRLTDGMDTVLNMVSNVLSGAEEAGNTTATVGLYEALFEAVQDRIAAGAAPAEGVLPGEGNLPPVEELPVPAQGNTAETLHGSDRQAVAEQLLQGLENLELPEMEKQQLAEQLKLFAQGHTKVSDLFALSEKLLQHVKHSEHGESALRALFGGEAFQKLLTNQLKNLWTIKPEEVSDPEKVRELYGRLDKQLNSLAHALEAGGQSGSEAFRAVTSMSQNLDFLQQLNQMYAYVQLPMRLQQGGAHGDLYVYANRKNLASADGQVSALLHLDMEHLGALDVYVALHNTNVKTQFYVQDEATLDFLGEHMDLLTERLKKRGYDCDFSMTARNEKTAEDKGLAPILEQDKGILLSRYAFDVRT